MSKKKKTIAIIAILLAILVSFLGGQTFSKYITEVVGKANAEIANWNFLVNESTATEQTIDITSTINNKTLQGNKIAPGTNGKFKITIDGEGSDVGIEYMVRVKNETTKPQHLYFTYLGQRYEELSEIVRIAGGIINATDENKKREIEIEWTWPYDLGEDSEEVAENDKIDTDNSKTIRDYKFDIVVTGNQLTPNAQAA